MLSRLMSTSTFNYQDLKKCIKYYQNHIRCHHIGYVTINIDEITWMIDLIEKYVPKEVLGEPMQVSMEICENDIDRDEYAKEKEEDLKKSEKGFHCRICGTRWDTKSEAKACVRSHEMLNKKGRR